MGKTRVGAVVFGSILAACATPPRAKTPTFVPTAPAIVAPIDHLPMGFHVDRDLGITGTTLGAASTLDGRLIAIATDADGLRVCAADTGRCSLPAALMDMARNMSAMFFDATGGTVIIVSLDGARFFDVATGAFSSFTEDTPGTRFEALSNDRTKLAMNVKDGVTIFDAKTGKELRKLKLKAPAERLDWSRNGETLAIATTDRSVRLVDPATGKTKAAFPSSGVVQRVDVIDNGIVLIAEDRHLKVWDLVARQALHDAESEIDADPMLSPDGALLASVKTTSKKGVRHSVMWLRDAKTGGTVATIDFGAHAIFNPKFSNDGRQIVCGASFDDDPSPLYVIDVAARKAHKAGPWATDEVALAGSRFFVWSRVPDAGTYVYDLAAGAAGFTIKPARPGETLVRAIAWSAQGDVIATLAPTRTMRLFDAKTGALLSTALEPPIGYRLPTQTQQVVFSPDGTHLFRRDETDVEYVDRAGKPAFRVAAAPGEIAISPDGLRLAYGDGPTVHLVDLEGKRLGEHVGGEGTRSLAFSPKTGDLLVVTRSGDQRLFDGTTLADKGQPDQRKGAAARFLADGTRVLEPLEADHVSPDDLEHEDDGTIVLGEAFNSELGVAAKADVFGLVDRVDRTVHLYDRKGGRTFDQGVLGASTIAFSPDGALFAVGGADLHVMRRSDLEGVHVDIAQTPTREAVLIQSDAGAVDGDPDVLSMLHVVGEAAPDHPPPELAVFTRSGLFPRLLRGDAMPRLEVRWGGTAP